MIRITLVCAAGMSTSMLVEKMKASAKEQGVETEIIAAPEMKFDELAGKTDILLLGPQVRIKLNGLKQKYEPLGLKVGLIDMKDYGRMNGEKVLKDALAMLSE